MTRLSILPRLRWTPRLASRSARLRTRGALQETQGVGSIVRDGWVARAAMRKWRLGALETVFLDDLKAKIASQAK